MKTLLLASALILSAVAPAMAEDAMAPAAAAPAAMTYEQAFTACTEASASAADKMAATKECMTAKGFEMKEDAAAAPAAAPAEAAH